MKLTIDGIATEGPQWQTSLLEDAIERQTTIKDDLDWQIDHGCRCFATQSVYLHLVYKGVFNQDDATIIASDAQQAFLFWDAGRNLVNRYIERCQAGEVA